MCRGALCESLVVVDLDLFEGVTICDSEEAFTSVLGAEL